MLESLACVVALIRRHLKDTVILVLLLMVVALRWQLNDRKNSSISLPSQSSLPPDVKQVITVYRDRVLTKWRNGPTKIEYRDRYLPPEGSAVLDIKKTDTGEAAELHINDHGFTCRLGGGTIYSGEILPEGDLKWFYFRRYSVLMGVTPRFGGVGLSRHIDDFTPFKNLELVGDAGLSWEGRIRLGIGIRSNF